MSSPKNRKRRKTADNSVAMESMLTKLWDEKIRIYGTCDSPVFVTSSVAKQLNVKPTGLCNICKVWNDPRYAYKALISEDAANSGSKRRYHWVFTEAGLYKYLMISRSELGQKLADWIFIHVLPSIRKTGKYEVEAETKRKLAKLNNQLMNLRKTLSDTAKEYEQQISELENENEKLEKIEEKMEEKLHELRDENESLEVDVDDAKKEVDDAKKEVRKLKRTYAFTGKQSKKLAVIIDKLEETITVFNFVEGYMAEGLANEIKRVWKGYYAYLADPYTKPEHVRMVTLLRALHAALWSVEHKMDHTVS